MGLIRAVGKVFDKDGSLYRYQAGHADLCNRTAAHALFECLGEEVPKDGFNEFVRQAKASYQETGSPLIHFSDTYRIQYELLDAKYHELLPVEGIIPVPGLVRAFDLAAKRGGKFAIATHSHHKFAERSIPHIGLSQYFDIKSNVVTLNQHGPEHAKPRSPKMVVDAANKIGLELRDIAFSDDEAHNFIKVKDEDSKVQTVLITWGNAPDKRPVGCDFIARDPVEVLKRSVFEPKTFVQGTSISGPR